MANRLYPNEYLLLFLFLLFRPTIISAQSEEGWLIKTTSIDPNNYYGITVANGMVGLVSSPQPLKMKETVLNGVFDTYGRGRVSNILKGFNFADVNLGLNGKQVSLEKISNYSQTLNMREGVFQTGFELEGASVAHKITALRHLPYTTLITLKVTATKATKLELTHELQAPDHLREVKNFYSVIDRPHAKIPLMTSVAQSPTGKHTVAASCSYLFDGVASHDAPDIVHEDWDYGRHLIRYRKELKAGETFDFTIVASTTSTATYADPHNEAERLTVYAALEGTERLWERHIAAWEKLWESDIKLEGDPEAQKDIRSALYHLYAFAREGTSFSLSPMGLSGLGYNGHVFWDTELWMFPPLLVLQPEMARSLLNYRYERLGAAKANAFAHGYKGAMFPWESDDAGQEATPVWALTGPFEHHITGCVGWAFWKYYQVTSDKQWLKEKGYPVLRNVADFWVSRVEKGDDGKLHINNVVGADEYAENVNDNAFTNGIAIASLRYAAQAARELGMEADPAWEQTADNIPILKMADGTTSEYEGYEGQVIKQADVNLLAYPLNIVTDETQIKRDLQFYEDKIDGFGPAMSHATLSTIYSRLGEPTEAYRLFLQTYQPNEKPPFNVLAEYKGGKNPYFATGAGGMLQAVLFGFAGLEITDEGISQQKSKLPKEWRSLTITGAGIGELEFVRK